MGTARVDAYRVTTPDGAVWGYDSGRPSGYDRWVLLHPAMPIPPMRKLPVEHSATPKDTNPKTAFGAAKASLGLIPPTALVECSLAMTAGDQKYGRANWLVDRVSASTYFFALLRHLWAWWSGQDFDSSGAHHLGHVIANAAIIIDARANAMLVDDRPTPSVFADYMAKRQDEFKAHNAGTPNDAR